MVHSLTQNSAIGSPSRRTWRSTRRGLSHVLILVCVFVRGSVKPKESFLPHQQGLGEAAPHHEGHGHIARVDQGPAADPSWHWCHGVEKLPGVSPKGPGAQAPFTEELEQLTSVIQEQKSSSRCFPSSNRCQDAQLAFPWKPENIAAMGVIHLLHLQV